MKNEDQDRVARVKKEVDERDRIAAGVHEAGHSVAYVHLKYGSVASIERTNTEDWENNKLWVGQCRPILPPGQYRPDIERHEEHIVGAAGVMAEYIWMRAYETLDNFNRDQESVDEELDNMKTDPDSYVDEFMSEHVTEDGYSDSFSPTDVNMLPWPSQPKRPCFEQAFKIIVDNFEVLQKMFVVLYIKEYLSVRLIDNKFKLSYKYYE